MYVTRKITALQLYFVLILSIGITNHVLLIPVLLHFGKRDSWVGASASLIPLLIWVCLLYIVVKRTKQLNMMEWIKQRFGKTVVFLFKWGLISIFLIHAFITLKDVVTWTHVSYLPRTPPLMISLVFMIFCFFAARAGMRAIAVTSGILLPVVIFLGYFVMGSNFQFKDYSLLTPLFTHGYGPTLTSIMLTCGASFELLSIVFLQHHVDTRIRLSSLCILALCVIGLTVGPLTGAIAIFGPFEAADLRYPAYEQWRMVTVGKYVSHLDFFSIFQWISGACVRTSMLMFLSVDVIGIKKKRTRTLIMAGISLFFLAVSLYPTSDNGIVLLIQNWYYPFMFGTGLGLLLIMLAMSILPIRRKEKNA
ncbi:spore germination protein (amino acid permease) [Paenibacillus sp. yr247]|uniref:endospore germination permease n=1 Tax=Paenibacillus sp. yr247 TaxID=1761880 RepID=UPI000891D1BF|nr:endospore germination permease [Paenibacillus sp. yr247]SDN37947.1 spore germination protein (amino acid permease) [Paenibacillus sp. yr247]